MPIRRSWSDEYWQRLDKETAKKIRTTCPRCGSSNTYYSERFRTWRCGKCEYSFVVEGLNNRTPWWRRLLGGGK